MTAYYNEIDPYAAQWLRNLITAGHIAKGEVDERSIANVQPDDLRGFVQCHFFAGIGGWSLALRLAGWPDDREVWTGSCPCQPFSAAGAGGGFNDERHLWPAFERIIAQCRPSMVFGEQVASKDADPWIDLVQADVEALGYAFGAVPFPSASVGAPHIRDRFYWVADALVQQRPHGESDVGGKHEAGGRIKGTAEAAGLCGTCGLEHPDGLRRDGRTRSAQAAERELRQLVNGQASEIGGMAYATPSGRREERADAGRLVVGDETQGFPAGLGAGVSDLRPSPLHGFWRDADWLLCRDGKWRPVEPGTFPLAHGAANRVGRLRAYGNAINAQAAATFIGAVMDCKP